MFQPTQHKRTIALQRLEPRPRVAGGNAGSQAAARLAAHWLVAPRLCEHRSATQDSTTRAHSFGRALDLDGAYPIMQLREHLGRRPKLARDGEHQLDRIRHRALGSEEVQRPRRSQPPARQQCRKAVDTRPMVHTIHQIVLHRVGRGVHQLVDDRRPIDQLHHAGLLGRPQVLPPASQGVLAASQQLMKMLDELRVTTGAIIDHRVVVVAHRARQHHVDLAAHGRVAQAVQERIVGRWVGAQQELPLGAATRDQVELARQDFTREHAPPTSKFSTNRVG
jgi:hypothetical protein